MSKETAKYADDKLGEVEDILLGLKDIANYAEPNFVEFKDGKPQLYLVRCYQCPDIGSYGRENYIPNVALGGCTWCGWRPNPKVVEEVMKNKMITSGLPAKEGMTLDEIKGRYPEAYQAVIEQIKKEK
jgi:hypothetical protein